MNDKKVEGYIHRQSMNVDMNDTNRSIYMTR